MHDPLTVAFEIRIWLPWKTDGLLKRDGRVRAKYHLATIWHKDPERDGTDDSCGWFKRARHGDKATLEKIVKRFEFDWDRVFKSDSGREYLCGYFEPTGYPVLSVSAITLNLFYLAAMEHFKSDGRTNWRRARRFMRRNLFDILFFSENPTDSLRASITLKFGNDISRADRIHSMASCVYGWILRAEQPWYRHPRWHIHHWRFQIHPLQRIWHWLTRRCAVCGKRFQYGESPIGNWTGTKVWHQQCEPARVRLTESNKPAIVAK